MLSEATRVMMLTVELMINEGSYSTDGNDSEQHQYLLTRLPAHHCMSSFAETLDLRSI